MITYFQLEQQSSQLDIRLEVWDFYASQIMSKISLSDWLMSLGQLLFNPVLTISFPRTQVNCWCEQGLWLGHCCDFYLDFVIYFLQVWNQIKSISDSGVKSCFVTINSLVWTVHGTLDHSGFLAADDMPLSATGFNYAPLNSWLRALSPMTAALINLPLVALSYGVLWGWRGQFGVGVCGNNSSLLMNGFTVRDCRKHGL